MDITFKNLTLDQVVELGKLYNSLTGNRSADIERTAQAIVPPAPQAPQPPQQPAQVPLAPMPPMAAAPISNAPTSADAPRDIKGTPYNPNLHASTSGLTGGKTKEGVWKMKKGVSRDEYEAWANQHAGSTASPAPMTPAPMAAPAPIAGAPFGQSVPMTPSLPAQPVTRDEFTIKCNQLQQRGILTSQTVDAIKQAVGCTDEVQILNDDNVRAAAYAELLKLEAQNAAALAA